MSDADVRAQYATSGNLNARIALHTRFSTAPTTWYAWVLSLLELAPGERLLEVGCGTGELWRATAGLLPRDVSLTLTDASAGMVERARDAGRATVLVADASALPFGDATFDIVVANHMLYHLADPALAIAEAARVLRPGGRIVTTTNGAGHLREIDVLIARHSAADRAPFFDLAVFSLETGGAILQRSFNGVALHRFENTLRVTDAAPLIAYVVSMGTRPDTLDVDSLSADVTSRMARDGAFVITARSGAFTARRS